jgi:hypothetical protein
LLQHFGDPVSVARSALRSWIARRPSDQDWRTWELTRSLELATGSVGPRPSMAKAVDGAAASLIAAGGSYGIDGALELLTMWVAASIHPSSPIDVEGSSSAAAVRCRALVACLAVSHHLCSAASVARHFNRAKSTLCEQMAARQSHAADRLILGIPLRRILEEVASLQAAVGTSVRHRIGVAAKARRP